MDRQKVLLIFIGAWVSAALLTWFLYAQTKAPKAARTVRVLVAARDMPAGTRLVKKDLRLVPSLERDVPKGALSDESQVLDHALIYPVGGNETLTLAKVTSLAGVDGLPAQIEPGKRAVSVQVNDSSGVAGLIQPRSHVDVLFTRPGALNEAVTTTVLEDVVVLAVGRATEISAAAVDTRVTRPVNQAATLLVTPEQARKLELAKNEGKVSLALRNPLDHGKAADREPTTALSLDLGPRRNLRDDRYWARLTGRQEEKPKPVVVEKKEPPKPHYVVDVYRGDKHVQEIFQ